VSLSGGLSEQRAEVCVDYGCAMAAESLLGNLVDAGTAIFNSLAIVHYKGRTFSTLWFQALELGVRVSFSVHWPPMGPTTVCHIF
jgi:hypothetical protein